MWGRRHPVRFDFALRGRDGVLDQMMTIQYHGQTTAAPVIHYRASDEQGRSLRVEVHSCYGSDRGEMALTDGENTDLLYFRGPDAHVTVDVAAEIVELRPLERPQNPITRVVQNDASGNELPSGGGFDHLTVLNPSPIEALCQVVAVALDEPGSGPQGAIAVVPMTQEPLLIPPRSQLRLDHHRVSTLRSVRISGRLGSPSSPTRRQVRRCTGKRLRGPWSDSAPSVTTSRSRIRFSNAGRLSADSRGYPQTRASGEYHRGRRGRERPASEVTTSLAASPI